MTPMTPSSRSLPMIGHLIASFYIVLSILGIAYAVSFATYISKTITCCLIIYFALTVICSLLVFVGIKKRESLFLMNWLVVQLIPLGYMVLAIILQPKLDKILIIPIVIGGVFHLYLWVIMIFVSRQCGEQATEEESISPEYLFYRKERFLHDGNNTRNQNPLYAQSDFSYLEPSPSSFYNIASSNNMRDSGDGVQHELPKCFYDRQKRKDKRKTKRYTQSDSNCVEPNHVLSIPDLMYYSGSWSNAGMSYAGHDSDIGLHSSSHQANDSGFMSSGGGDGGGIDTSGGGGGCDSGGGGGGGGGCD